jgi:hypothetical protein
MTSKLIEFPKSKVVREVPEEQQKVRQARAEQKMADAIVDDVADMCITELDNCTIDVQQEQFAKDFIMVIDSLRACVYRQFGIDHHLHDFVDRNVAFIEGDMDSMSDQEIKEKIEAVMKDLSAAKEKLDAKDEEE